MTTAIKTNAVPAALTLLLFIAGSLTQSAGGPAGPALSTLLGLN